MADQKDNPRKNWSESMRDRRRALQADLESLELGQPDSELAARVRSLISQIRAMDAAIEDVEKFFPN
jgi:hypothetical protein